MGNDQLLRHLLPTTVVGSYSVPEWLERLKTECYQRRISPAHLAENHEVAIKAAIKDQEHCRAGSPVTATVTRPTWRALARRLNLEARSLAAAGAGFLQIDEPFLAGYPDQAALAVEAVNIVTDGVPVTWALHVCYGNRYARPSREGHYDFLFPAVLRARVDQLVLEFARKGLDDLHLIKDYGWPSQLGLGVIDVKSPAMETPELVAERIRRAVEYVEPARLMVNPDCGLRHLAPEAARRKLRAMVAGAAIVRTELGPVEFGPVELGAVEFGAVEPGVPTEPPSRPGDGNSRLSGSQPTGDSNG